MQNFEHLFHCTHRKEVVAIVVCCPIQRHSFTKPFTVYISRTDLHASQNLSHMHACMQTHTKIICKQSLHQKFTSSYLHSIMTSKACITMQNFVNYYWHLLSHGCKSNKFETHILVITIYVNIYIKFEFSNNVNLLSG